jgi:hypothetical protein
MPTIPMGKFEARIAATPEDRLAVFRLRYQVYVLEMGRPGRYVNHQTKTIEEPYDRDALIYGLFNEAKCVATVRANGTKDCGMEEYLELYNLSPESSPIERCVISTKVMADKECRNLKAIKDFWIFFYLDLLERGYQYIFCDCNDNVLRFFLRLGFVHSSPKTTSHPEFGTVNLLRADMFDLAHAKSVGSPLADALSQYLSKSKHQNES